MKSTHFDKHGRAKMVEINKKEDTFRIASVKGTVKMKCETLNMIKKGLIGKGDVLAVAQFAGIMAAKKTAYLIPMCHNIPLTGAKICFKLSEDSIEIESEITAVGKTGVEMEALTAVSVTALTIYDMCKSVDRDITIENIRLIKKAGGKSGLYIRKE